MIKNLQVYNALVSINSGQNSRVEIRVVKPRSILNKSGTDRYSLNPYAGCLARCGYCYVPHMRHMATQTRAWGTYIDIKEGAAALLQTKLARMKKPVRIFIGSATDPYNPVEEQFKITRSVLEVLLKYPQHRTFLLTKQTLVLRDADLFNGIPHVSIGMSISTMDEALSRKIEPCAPATSERLATLRRLSESGISTFCLWAPVFVPFKPGPEFISASVRKVKETEVKSFGADSLNYQPSIGTSFLRILAQSGHRPASTGQIEMIIEEAGRHGLGRSVDLDEITGEIDTQPFLPFDTLDD